MMTPPRRVVIEADGGSRGNPGPAAYGALLRDADTGAVLAERAEHIGTATNNVAEYRGLLAGLELAREHTPDAELEVRMDSKLVVEQMAGRWKIKHPDLRPLAIEAQRLAPFGTEWTWVPREENAHADRLLNVVLDAAVRGGAVGGGGGRGGGGSGLVVIAAGEDASKRNPVVGWNSGLGEPARLLLLRHGATDYSAEKRFSGWGGADLSLNESGIAQVNAAAEWLRARGDVDKVVTSPLARTRQTADIVAEPLDLKVEVEDGLRETAFGEWDGYTFAEVQERWPAELEAWQASTSVAPPGGESFEAAAERVRRTRDRLVSAHHGQTVLAVTHVTPIKLLVRLALDAPLDAIYKMEVSAGSITEIHWYPGGASSLRSFSLRPDGRAQALTESGQ
ncbi:MAG: bifunctional RNase H/acid phosphatase [Propionibacteriales bacterium]|nr:bifunctional RNase H/acid phosphatase [Propionibacteriales bacterium]